MRLLEDTLKPVLPNTLPVRRRLVGVAAVVAAIAAGAVGVALVSPLLRQSAHPPLARADFETGWIFAGYYNSDRSEFSEGPFVELAESGEAPWPDLQKGERIRIRTDRQVIIVDYARSGQAEAMRSPITIPGGVLRDEDYSGVQLRSGEEFVVRDLTVAGVRGNPEQSVWLRVAPPGAAPTP